MQLTSGLRAPRPPNGWEHRRGRRLFVHRRHRFDRHRRRLHRYDRRRGDRLRRHHRARGDECGRWRSSGRWRVRGFGYGNALGHECLHADHARHRCASRDFLAESEHRPAVRTGDLTGAHVVPLACPLAKPARATHRRHAALGSSVELRPQPETTHGAQVSAHRRSRCAPWTTRCRSYASMRFGSRRARGKWRSSAHSEPRSALSSSVLDAGG